jgi:N-acetylglucosaminyl-diphospho-decaprenol L-rhamnosyltransferase
MNQVDITLAIINYNTKSLLKTCIDSIEETQPLAGYEIIVIDNGSADGSAEMMKQDFPQIHFLENAGNLGYAAAANQALRTSRAKYVMVLNTDIELDRDAIDILVEHADRHDDLGIAGPLLLNTDGSVQMSGRRFPSFLDAMAHAFLGIVWPRNPFSARYRMLDWDRSTDSLVDWVSGAAMLIRRSAAEDVGYFDEGYFMYVEDMDLCYQMWRRGWKVYFCPDSKIIHHIGQASNQVSAKMIIEFQRSLYRFFNKTYSDTNKRWLKPLVACALVLRAGALITLDWFQRRNKKSDHSAAPGQAESISERTK